MLKRYFLPIFIYLFSAIVVNSSEISRLIILQTTDIHGCFEQGKEPGGWLQLATIIKRERQTLGKKNCLLIDCGDTIQGSLISQFSQGEVSRNMLNLLDYDAWIIGNHDFDFGSKILQKHCKNIDAAILAANLSWTVPETVQPLSWQLFKRGGIKIAVVGMTYPFLDNIIWGKKLLAFKTTCIESSLKRIMPEIMKTNPDIILLATHHGLIVPKNSPENNLFKIAAKYPQIDLILGGHIHQSEPGKRIAESWYAQTNSRGNQLLRVEIRYDKTKKQIIDINSRLLPVTTSTSQDQASQKVLRDWQKKCRKFGWEKIGKTKNPITPIKGTGFHAPINELFCLAITQKTGASVAFHGSIRKKYELQGNINEWQLFHVAPHEDTIGILELNGEEIRKIIAEQIQKYNRERFQSPWGIKVNVDRNGKVIGKIRFADGQIWHDESKRLKVAFNSYALAGAGTRFPVLKALAAKPGCKPVDTQILVRDALRSYIKNHSPLQVKTVEWLKMKKSR